MYKVSSLLIGSALSATIEQASETIRAKELFLSSFLMNYEEPTEELFISNIDINSVAPCQYVTMAAFFNLGGIKNQDQS